MNISFLHKPLGCLILLVLMLSIMSKIYYNAVDVVQTHVVKKFNPSYKTRIETLEEQKKEQTKIAKEKAEKAQPEINLEKNEESKYQQMWGLVDERKILYSIGKENTKFIIPSIRGFYVLNNSVWVCGITLIYDENLKISYYCPAIVASEDGGNSYKIIKVFCEFNTGFMHSKLFFIDKNIGYLEIFGAECNKVLTRAKIYKTTDGGHNWNIILDTTNFRLFDGWVSRIRAENQKITLITALQKGGSLDLIQSDDDGKSWAYIKNGKKVAKTYDKGETWEVLEK